MQKQALPSASTPESLHQGMLGELLEDFMQKQALPSAAAPKSLPLGLLGEWLHLGQGAWDLGVHDGRAYFVYTPVNYQVGKAVPLIMILHGCAQSEFLFPATIAFDTHMNPLADKHQFLVVYPFHADPLHLDINPISCWNFFLPVNQHRDSGEPLSLAGIVHDILGNTSQWTIDPNRIYVAGISSGAGAAVNLGVTYPDLFAAIGVHSGGEYGYRFLFLGEKGQAPSTLESLCEAKALRGEGEKRLPPGPPPIKQGEEAFKVEDSFARVVPTIVFHGTADQVVDFENGNQVTQQWLTTNHLASHGAFTATFEHPSSTIKHPAGPHGERSYTVNTWQDANGRDVVTYYQVEGMRHAWSGGSPGSIFTDPKGPDASQIIYDFFMAHPKETAARGAKSATLEARLATLEAKVKPLV